ncbi:hypothetical protein ACQJBY_053280 [Aegilops geniculata]
MTVRCSEGNSDNGGIYPRRASTPVAACRGAEFEDIFQFVGETQTQIGFGWRLIPLPQSVQSCVALHRSFFDRSKGLYTPPSKINLAKRWLREILWCHYVLPGLSALTLLILARCYSVQPSCAP